MTKFDNFYKKVVNEVYTDDFKDVYPAEHTTGNLLKVVGELVAGRVGVKRARVIIQILKKTLYLNDTDLNDILNTVSQKEHQKTPGDSTQM